MLHKKLKSLGANTTSNQYKPAKILDVPDFLNKYGDMQLKMRNFEPKKIMKIFSYISGVAWLAERKEKGQTDKEYRLSPKAES